MFDNCTSASVWAPITFFLRQLYGRYHLSTSAAVAAAQQVPRLSMLGVSVHGFARKNTPSIQTFFGAAATAASGGGSGLFSVSSPPSLLPCKPARTSSAGNRPKGLGFPTAAVATAAERREVGVKRRRPWGGAGEGGARATGARQAEADTAHVDAGGYDDGASGGGGRARRGISVDSRPGSGDRDGTLRDTGGAGREAVALREKGGQRQRERGGGDADVWCEGVRGRDIGKGEEEEEEEETEKATGGSEGDDGVQFCGVVQGRGESTDSPTCEVVLQREQQPEAEVRGEEDAKGVGAEAAAVAGVVEGLAAEESGRRPGEGQRSKTERSSRRSDDNATTDANEQPRALFGRGGASGVFGEVDPGVLAELPSEIQREIWMQQVPFFGGGGRGCCCRL